MHPKTYALGLSAGGAALFLALVATNVVIDPQAVFGTGLLRHALNANDRYEQFAAYQAASDSYDGLFFGSSRGKVFPTEELSLRMNGVKFARFAVAGGAIEDHVSVLDFVLREKTSKGERLRAVFLLLDVDMLGAPTLTNLTIQFRWPPALTGENSFRFWWRYLVAIQFRTWRSAIREGEIKWGSGQAPARTAIQMLEDRLAGISAAGGSGNSHARPPLKSPAASAGPAQLMRITERADFRGQLASLERLVMLCRKNGIELVVATTPLHPDNEILYDPLDMANAIGQIRHIVPVWDFSKSGRLTDHAGLWSNDKSHFSVELAQLMLRRVFRDEMPPDWEEFGRLLKRDSLSQGS